MRDHGRNRDVVRVFAGAASAARRMAARCSCRRIAQGRVRPAAGQDRDHRRRPAVRDLRLRRSRRSRGRISPTSTRRAASQVTRNHPPIAGQDTLDHPEFHPGIWMAFGDISGNDYWRLKARVEHVAIRRAAARQAGKGSFAVRNRYLDAADPNQSRLRRSVPIHDPRAAGRHICCCGTRRSARDHEFSFGDQEEMGLGIRVATPLRVESRRRLDCRPATAR